MNVLTNKNKTIPLVDQLLLEKYEPIAIVGISLRFPGGINNVNSFEELLEKGLEGIATIPSSRWDNNLYYDPIRGTKGKNCTNEGGYIDDFSSFDAKFFAISPKEANNMDPQQRIMLELAWEALENANINPQQLRGGNGSVFIGGSTIDFAKEVVHVHKDALESHMATGTANSAISGRVSYFLDLQGPSMTLDTACSSSLVALHLACNALRNKETDLSLCGAVNLIHYAANHIIFSQAGMLAPDGRCKTFDEKADGYGRSEGAAVVVLKRLSDAIKDKNHIIALVKGTAVLQDGDSGGLTVPNGFAQESVMRQSLKKALCDAKDINYVEAHGTGTPLGDPIEIQAIHRIFSECYDKKNPIPVGSVKTNIGHMEAAAGMGSLIKVLLQLQNNKIYSHLNFTNPSSHIPWDELAVEIPVQARVWPEKTKRALINSFGFAGTVASAIIEETPPALKNSKPLLQSPLVTNEPAGILTISAKTETALKQLLSSYHTAITGLNEKELVSFCQASNTGRAHFQYRYADKLCNKTNLLNNLQQTVESLADEDWNIAKHKSNSVVFLYTGQGAQYLAMGKILYQKYALFQKTIDECDSLFSTYLEYSIKQVMFNEIEQAETLLAQTAYTQPALFTFEYALTQLWLSWGVTPSVLIGHSIGEIVAAAVAHVFHLADAIKLVANRALLMQSVQKQGGMVAVMASHHTIEKYLVANEIEFAGINSPRQCVISGELTKLEEVCKLLNKEGINYIPLNVSHAFHSNHMDSILSSFKTAIQDIQFNPPIYSIISNITGKIADAKEITQLDYWVKHIREPVNFLAGIQTIDQLGSFTFIEMGPQPHLITLAKQSVEHEKHLWLYSAKANTQEVDCIFSTLCTYYRSGAQLNWHSIHEKMENHYYPLPPYPFDKKRYWLEAKKECSHESVTHPLLGQLISTDGQKWVYSAACSPANPSYLADHVVMDKIIYPAAGFIEIIIALQDQVFGHTQLCIKDFYIEEPLLLHEGTSIQLITQLTTQDERYYFEISSQAESLMHRHAYGYLEHLELGAFKQEMMTWLQNDTQPALETYNQTELYQRLLEKKLAYGEQFRNAVHTTKLADNVVKATINNPHYDLTFLPPPVLDAVLNSIDVLLEADKLYLPVGFGEFYFLKKPKSKMQCKMVLKKLEPSNPRYDCVVDIILHDAQGPVFIAKELRSKMVSLGQTNKENLVYFQQWQPMALKNNRHKLTNVLFVANTKLVTPEVQNYIAKQNTVFWANDVSEIRNKLITHSCQKLVYFWQTKTGSNDNFEFRQEAEINFKAILELLSLLDSEFSDQKIELFFVTSGGQVLVDDHLQPQRLHHLIQSSLHGFQAVLLNESPIYQSRIIDFDSLESEQLNNMMLLINEIYQSNEHEYYQIAYRENNRYVLNLNCNEPTQNLALTIKNYGTFANIQQQIIPMPEPAADELVVQVEAAGLNFKDVINVLGLLKAHFEQQNLDYQPLPLGFECAGIVINVGESTEFSIGDEVIVSHIGCMQRYIKVNSKNAVKKPKNLRFTEAAAIPTAYITAYYALYQLARIKNDDTILIHAGAGGVGQAAIQLAKRAGAKIITSASQRKHDFLKKQGIADIINSRDACFAETIKSKTNGRGVDIVLNSFNKEFIAEGFDALALNGRFIELGKIDIWTKQQAENYRSDAAYHSFDLSELPVEELQQVNKNALEAIVSYLENKEIQPIPTTIFNLTQVEDAFALLAKGENRGKIVINFNDRTPVNYKKMPDVSSEKTYLITGGYGALAQHAMNWLINRGAKHIALLGRSLMTHERLGNLQKDLNDPTVSLIALQGDIADCNDMERCFATLKNYPPLGGIIHAAGVIKDAPISKQTWANFEEVFLSKVYGTWLLHEITQSHKDIFFIAYSSVASVVGSAGQANYSAANAFIDNLMVWRSCNDLHGLAINWGPWSEVGMAAQLEKKQLLSIEKKGIHFITPYQAMTSFTTAVDSSYAQSIISSFNWPLFAANMVQKNAYFAKFLPQNSIKIDDYSVENIKNLPREQSLVKVSQIVRAKLATVLHFDNENDIEINAQFSDLGLDSLVSVEFKNVIEKTFNVSLKNSDVFDFPSVPQFSAFILEQWLSLDDGSAKPKNKNYIRKLLDKVIS